MTMHLADVTRWQPASLDLAAVKAAGFGAVNIQTSGRDGYVSPTGWVRGHVTRARELGLGVCLYHWLDNQAGGGEQAGRFLARAREAGAFDGPFAHQVDCEDSARPASQPVWRDHVTAVQQALGRHVLNYSGDWWWTAPGRGWHGADLTPYLMAAPNAGYLQAYPGDDSPHWVAGWGGWLEYSALQYRVGVPPGTSLPSLSQAAFRDPAVWPALIGEEPTVPTTSRPNPNPTRISGPMWWLVCALTDNTPTSFVNEYGGTFLRKPGSHADTAWLKANYPNDYSLKGVKQSITTGPLSAFTRAFDWTFPSAQRGDWSEIGVYSLRVKAAYDSNDPRMYGVFEILCQTPEDREPEGYVFYPERRFRVPDSTHEWHHHIGILTQYVNDQAAMEALASVLLGESLSAWRARMSGGKAHMGAATIFFDGTGYGCGDGVGRMVIITWDEMLLKQAAAKAGELLLNRNGDIVNTKSARTYGVLIVDAEQWQATGDELESAIRELAERLAAGDNGLPVDVDALVTALEAAVADDVEALNATMERLADKLADGDNGLPMDRAQIIDALKQALREGAGTGPGSPAG